MKNLLLIFVFFIGIGSAQGPLWANDFIGLTEPDRQVMLSEAVAIPAWGVSPLEAPTPADYWTNSLSAMGGSAVGYGVIIVGMLAIEALPIGLKQIGYLDQAAAWEVMKDEARPEVLLPVPVFLAPLFMHLFSPDAQMEHFDASLAGSAAGILIHTTLVVLPLLALFGQEKLNQSLYLIAPASIATGMLIQGFSSATAHQWAENIRVESRHSGLHLSQNWSF